VLETVRPGPVTKSPMASNREKRKTTPNIMKRPQSCAANGARIDAGYGFWALRSIT
jgi:hypothetical protein